MATWLSILLIVIAAVSLVLTVAYFMEFFLGDTEPTLKSSRGRRCFSYGLIYALITADSVLMWLDTAQTLRVVLAVIVTAFAVAAWKPASSKKDYRIVIRGLLWVVLAIALVVLNAHVPHYSPHDSRVAGWLIAIELALGLFGPSFWRHHIEQRDERPEGTRSIPR